MSKEINYETRTKCIFCESKLETEFFKNDIENYTSHYAVDFDFNDFISIPYNVYICDVCNTPQNKYLANINDVYKINHADSTGTTMINLHQETLKMILKYKDNINNIIEIGSSVGVLADMILSNIDLEYNIIEPSYIGKIDGKNIHNDFYENVDDINIDANTMIISHVFEHFYNPKKIIDKIHDNYKIDNFFLVFPDLEYYINNNILHVLNTEHTYYIDNDFLIDLLKSNGFELIEKSNYKNHSVLFYFKRNNKLKQKQTYKNVNFNLNEYFENISKTVMRFNDVISENENTFLWPASIHTLYLISFGLDISNVYGFLDNSKLKIGKKMYGTDKVVYKFDDVNSDMVVCINGGVFNDEVEKILIDNKVKYYI